MDKDDALDRMRLARMEKPKPEKRPMRQMSEKTKAKKAEERKLVSSNGDTFKEQWFKARRIEMTGTCQCGCGEPSQKKDNMYFRYSAAHIFPKRLFPSVEYHPLNWVERRFWAGVMGTSACHSIMDDTSIQRWPGMADWEDIRMKFMFLAPLLTDEERATNFYIGLEKLVYAEAA